MYYWVARSSCKDSLKVLEEDVERANALLVSIFPSLFIGNLICLLGSVMHLGLWI